MLPMAFISFSYLERNTAACTTVLLFFCFFFLYWYEKTRAFHNARLVFCGQEEPGSAPVTQLLMALVLSFGLTSSTCLLILCTIAYLLCGMCSMTEASLTETNSPNLVVYHKSSVTFPPNVSNNSVLRSKCLGVLTCIFVLM